VRSKLTLVALLVIFTLGGCGGGGFDPTLRVTLQVDTASLSPDASLDDALAILENRIDAFGGESEVTVADGNSLVAEVSGMTTEEATFLLGRTGFLHFAEPVTNEQDQIICETSDGMQFPLISTGPVGGKCLEDGQLGDVVWIPATGLLDGEEQALTGRHVVPGSAVGDIGPSGPEVILQFTAEGAVLFDQITGRLAPDGILGMLLDDELLSAPTVVQQITGDTTTITGLESLAEAEMLAIIITAGVLPAQIESVTAEESA
jgi:preprotein translocase subunit SecD